MPDPLPPIEGRPLDRSDLFRSPACFIALGFGAGLATRGPGTWGTLVGVPLAFLMPASPIAQLLVLLPLFAFGIWCCGEAARELGVHDHGGIVWDEIVGYLLVMSMLPKTLPWLLAAFVLFRVFDIAKPWPIGPVDRRMTGGLGIMLDDVIAAILAGAPLWLLAARLG